LLQLQKVNFNVENLFAFPATFAMFIFMQAHENGSEKKLWKMTRREDENKL
jgi:hypothetical protein